MSRKRASTRSAALAYSNVSCDTDLEEYEYEYYRPGCYCTPQVVRHATPYTCAYLHEYPAQWNVCNTATYVVDAYGMVYYLSDFEHQLQLPGNLAALDSEISYHYLDNSGACANAMAAVHDEEEEEEEAVSPRKRERFDESDIEEELEGGNVNDHEVPQQTQHITLISTTLKPLKKRVSPPAVPLKSRGNVYRSEQGYLVEEPIEPESASESAPEPATPAKSKAAPAPPQSK